MTSVEDVSATWHILGWPHNLVTTVNCDYSPNKLDKELLTLMTVFCVFLALFGGTSQTLLWVLVSWMSVASAVPFAMAYI